MPDRPALLEMTAAQLYERAAGYTAMARITKLPDLRNRYDRLAGQYARLAAERDAEEDRARQH